VPSEQHDFFVLDRHVSKYHARLKTGGCNPVVENTRLRTYTQTGRSDELEVVGNKGWTVRKTCYYPGAKSISCVALEREGYINHLRVDVP
jgi:hypothetical protein